MERKCLFCGISLNEDNEQLLDHTKTESAFDTHIKVQQLTSDWYICKKCYQEKNKLKPKNSLKKAEILSLKKLISGTFADKKSVTHFPFKIFYRISEIESPYPAQALFTVPKRNFKKAVDRNLLRRRIKEAYRQNKHTLYASLEAQKKQMSLIIIYIGKQKTDYAKIENELSVSLGKIIQKIEQL